MIAKIMETIYALHDDEIDNILCILHQDVGREGSLYCERCKCPEKLEPNWKVLYDELADTTHKYRNEWKAKHDDLNDVHKSLSSKYNELMQNHCDKERGKDKEWTDDMSEQADKDYDAVTKGVISLINLLRR